MKHITFATVLLLVVLSISSCKEDEYVDWKLLNNAWLEKHKSDPGFTQTESGLCYKIIHKGTGAQASLDANSGYGSLIRADYKGQLIDGSVFANSFDESDDEYTTYLSSSIAGWKEILPKLKVGGSCELYVPADLAYGSDGSGKTIPPHSVLIFKIEVLDIVNQ